MPDNRSTGVHSSASRFRRSRQWLIAVGTVAVLAACGTAGASSSTPRASGPTAAEVHVLDVAHNEQMAVNVKTLAATEWYNEAQRQEAERFFEAAAAAEAEQAAAAAASAKKSAAVKPAVAAAAPTGRGGSNYADGAGGFFACTRRIESGGNYATNTGNGYYGAYQFDDATWHAQGGTGHASDAPPAEQDARAASLYAQRGNAPWGGRC